MTFVLYALFSLLIGIIICILLISMVDRYRINLNYKYENLSTRYDIPENGSFTATYSNDQTKYTIFDTKGNEICKFNVDYQKERPVHEYVYPNHVSYIEVLPNFTNRDRLIDSALGSLNIAIIPIVLSISMICCVTFFYKKKLSKPIKLLTNAYHKIEANDLDFTLSYPLNDEMGKLCHAFEKMKDCLSKNNETMFRQFAEQRRLNAAFSHDLRTPLTLLKGHATMLLSFIPKGLVSQQEILDEISVMSKNISRLEKYVNAMTNLYRLEDIDIPRQQITFHSLIDNFNNTAEALCYDKHFSITTSGNNITLFINLDTVMQIYENLLSNSIRYAKSDIAISVVIENDNLVISVSDDGCGFKNIDIEKATLPFYKSSKDIATEHLGLGLNISKILSERHGGNIQIANAVLKTRMEDAQKLLDADKTEISQEDVDQALENLNQALALLEKKDDGEDDTTVYKNGIYEGRALCRPDEDEDFTAYNLTLQVTVRDDKIVAVTDVKGDGDSSNDRYILRAANGTSNKKGVTSQLIEKGNTEGIDAVSGATCTSKAILDACENALLSAKRQ